MPLTTLRISPGIVRNGTRYSASGTWYDGSLVRFRDGFPEKWSGWADAYPSYVAGVTTYGAFTMDGVCRSLHRHGDLDGVRWTSAGTSKRFYMLADELRYDVTPTAEVVVLAANQLSATNTSTTVTVTDAAHGQYPGNTVIISGATTFAGIPAVNLNKEHTIVTWISDSQYTITVAAAATSTAVGGGTPTLTYLFAAGNDDVVGDTGGWGSGAWSEGTWGTSGVGSNLYDQLGIWTQDNWGEDLVACAFQGPIFYWTANTPSTRMVNIRAMVGADGNAPSEAAFIIVSHRDRHLIAFGCTPMGGGAVQPMLVRWCNQEAITEWNEAALDQTAGNLPLSNGSRFLAGIATARENLVWTDQALYSLQYVGPPDIYSADLLDRWSDICGMKASCSFGGVIYWMGSSGFYSYSGRTEKLPCPIWDYITNRLNRDQMIKVYASSNLNHNEVLWFYPSDTDGNAENDSYVALNVADGIWTYGALPRTAWFDRDALDQVVAASPPDSISDARLFEHDFGTDDGSTEPASPIEAFIESGPIELGSEGDKGDRMMFIRTIIPDVTFRDITTSSAVPLMNITLTMMDEPGSPVGDTASPVAQRGVLTVPVEQFTRRAGVRLRGRSLTVRAESNVTGSNWRMGLTRLDIRTDGQK